MRRGEMWDLETVGPRLIPAQQAPERCDVLLSPGKRLVARRVRTGFVPCLLLAGTKFVPEHRSRPLQARQILLPPSGLALNCSASRLRAGRELRFPVRRKAA